jgi:hypothetical protein
MPAILRWSLVLSALTLAACRPPDTVDITDETSRGQFRDEPEPVETGSPQRFPANMYQELLMWTTPATWTPVQATEFRHINFTCGPNREVECYLTFLSSAGGGGVLENFNRWRGQFKLPPISEAEMAALPQKTFLGRTAPAMDLSGDFDAGAMSGGGLQKGWRMLGIISEVPGAVITVKMTGPQALVEAEAKNFDAFLASIVPAPPLR